MKKLSYTVSVMMASVGFLFVFGTTILMHLDFGKITSKINALESDSLMSKNAYARFVNGRTLNSDYAFWKRLDDKYSTRQLVKVNQSDFLKGVAVFQKAFWKKYVDKNKIEKEIVNWEEGFAQVDKKLQDKIVARYPLKETIGKKLNSLSFSIDQRLTVFRDGKNNLFQNLMIQYVLLAVILLFNLTFFMRKTKVVELESEELKVQDDLSLLPISIIKLEDDRIISYSNKVKEITPNIIEYKNWNDFFITNFSVVKNINGEKIISLRRSKDKRFKIQTSVDRGNRYINFVPVVTIVRDNAIESNGSDSLNEIVKESIHRLELMSNQLSFDMRLENDLLVQVSLGEKVEQVISLVGTFYKRLSTMQNRKVDIAVNIRITGRKVEIIFSSEKIRLEPSAMRNISNFNFSYYPQKIENSLMRNEGKVSIKNRYDNNKKFTRSEFNISFDIDESKYKVGDPSQVSLGN